MKNKRLEKIIVLYGFSWVLTMVSLMFITFFLAFFSPVRATMVTVDSFGEANIEFVLLLSGLPCVVYCLYFLMTEEETKKEG